MDHKRCVGSDGWAMLVAVGDVVDGCEVDEAFIERHASNGLRVSVHQGVRGDDLAGHGKLGSVLGCEVREDATELWVRLGHIVVADQVPRRALMGPAHRREGLVVAAPPVAPYPGDREQRGDH